MSRQVRLVGLLGALALATGACGEVASRADASVDPEVDAGGNPTLSDAGEVQVLDASIPGISRNGWTWNNVGPQAADLYAVWGSSSSDVWFVGAAGVILHWDGRSFSAASSGTAMDLHGVWGSGPTDVWAAGTPPLGGPQDGQVLHYDGSAWSVVATVPGASFYALHGSATSDVWAVGSADGDGGYRGVTAHWDGSAWTQATVSASSGFSGVWAAGPGDAWAVGGLGDFGGSALVMRWDGTSWSNVAVPDSGAPYASASYAHVWGAGPSDVWLVGETAVDLAEDPSGYAVHWNGSGWDPAHVEPAFASPIRGVFGSATNDVSFVGSAGVAELWDGAAWSERRLPGDYEAVWESGPGDRWAVGLGGVMAHWDGHAWTQLVAPPPAYGVNPIASIWADRPDDAWVVGNGPVSANLQHWDGHTWAPRTIESTDPAYLYFERIWGAASDDVWGVGASLSGPKQSGRIVHYDGHAWSVAYDEPASMTATTSFMSVWGASADDVWFAETDGTLLHWNGSAFRSTTLGGAYQVTVLGGTASDDVWLTGGTNDAAVVRHWDGHAWSTVYTSPFYVSFSSLFAASRSDAWLVAAEGGALHWDGVAWSAPSPAPPLEVGSVWGSSPSDVWAVGFFGASMHWDGAVWSSVPITSQTLTGVAGTGPLDVWMVTESGAILHHP